jgi:two-component system chemotaxis sensor kinase CheA
MPSGKNDDSNNNFDLEAYKGLFLEQARVFLELLRASLTSLEGNPQDVKAFQEGRRATHTLKGMSATMRYETLSDLAAGLERPFLSDSPISREQLDALQAGCEEFGAALDQLAAEEESSA